MTTELSRAYGDMNLGLPLVEQTMERTNEHSGAEKRQFISIEGGDGAGKTTTLRLVYKRLVSEKVPVILVYPKRPHFEDDIVEHFMTSMLAILRGPRNLLTDKQWLHLTSMWYHIISNRIVRPALRRGDIVIADTWYHKPMVRFGLIEKHLFDEAQRCFSGLEQPSFTCFLDIDPELAASRKSEFGFGETGNFEEPRAMNRENFVTYQRRFRDALCKIAREEEWQMIKAGQLGADIIADQILHMMKKRDWI